MEQVRKEPETRCQKLSSLQYLARTKNWKVKKDTEEVIAATMDGIAIAVGDDLSLQMPRSTDDEARLPFMNPSSR